MRRGQELENYINSLIKLINGLGWHGHKNNPNRTVTGITIKGEPFDFEIITPYCFHAFDAKECSSVNVRWKLTPFTGSGKDARRMNSQLYTLNALNRCDFCWAYFLVWFKHFSGGKKIFCFSPDVVLNALHSGRTYLTPEDGVKWPLPERLTFTKGDLVK